MEKRISREDGEAALKTLTDLLAQEQLLTTNVANSLERIEDALNVMADRAAAKARGPRFFER